MTAIRQGERSAVGFTVKSGWACAVLIAGTPGTPRVLDCRRVDLSDPAIPEARQPYHAGFGTARDTGPELAHLVASVRRFGLKSVSGLLREYRRARSDINGAGIVVGSLIDPRRIANDHIRIHALEGALFRRVVEEAARRMRIPSTIWRERDLYGLAAEGLHRPERSLRQTLTTIGRAVEPPWRAEQKMATVAAWLVLAALPTGRRAAAQRVPIN